jgi:O-Antigen ligase
MPLKFVNTAGIAPAGGLRISGSGRISRWKQGLAFLFGFFLQFNVLAGGGGEGASAMGGYGFRVLDLLSVIAFALLLVHALPPRRVLALTVFVGFIGLLAVLRTLEPTFWHDPRTLTLATHYVGYAFAGLYLAILCSEEYAVHGFCWGMIAGLLATVPIFVLQDLGYSSTLISLGLVPGYYGVLALAVGNVPRYSGLWGHPNEAGHIAALAGAAGAYFVFAYRRFVPMAVIGAALLTIFYFTQSRGGLIAGGSVMLISLLFGKRKRIDFQRLALLGVIIFAVVELLLQIDFVVNRFEEDPTNAHNFSERLLSMWAGLELALGNPFGLSIDVYNSIMESASGVGTPHNGFLAFAIILGMVPLLVLLIAFGSNFRIRTNADAFFFFLTLQVCVSFLFEQLPATYDFAFVTCMIVGYGFLRTGIGSELKAAPPSSAARFRASLGGPTRTVFTDRR